MNVSTGNGHSQRRKISHICFPHAGFGALAWQRRRGTARQPTGLLAAITAHSSRCRWWNGGGSPAATATAACRRHPARLRRGRSWHTGSGRLAVPARGGDRIRTGGVDDTTMMSLHVAIPAPWPSGAVKLAIGRAGGPPPSHHSATKCPKVYLPSLDKDGQPIKQ